MAPRVNTASQGRAATTSATGVVTSHKYDCRRPCAAKRVRSDSSMCRQLQQC